MHSASHAKWCNPGTWLMSLLRAAGGTSIIIKPRQKQFTGVAKEKNTLLRVAD